MCGVPLVVIFVFLFGWKLEIGLCDFGDKGELPLEVVLTTSIDKESGIFTAKAVDFASASSAERDIPAEGLLSCDLVWNNERKKYEETVSFRLSYESHNVSFECEFNLYDFEHDLKSMYFEGICVRYPSSIAKEDDQWDDIAHKGLFQLVSLFVCHSFD